MSPNTESAIFDLRAESVITDPALMSGAFAAVILECYLDHFG